MWGFVVLLPLCLILGIPSLVVPLVETAECGTPLGSLSLRWFVLGTGIAFLGIIVLTIVAYFVIGCVASLSKNHITDGFEKFCGIIFVILIVFMVVWLSIGAAIMQQSNACVSQNYNLYNTALAVIIIGFLGSAFSCFASLMGGNC